MKTKFNKNDKVKIKFHGDTSYIGKTGIVTDVIPVIKDEEVGELIDIPYALESNIKGTPTTGFYEITLDGENKSLPGYAFDLCLEKINGEE